MCGPMIRLVIDSRIDEIARAADFLQAFCASHALADEDAHALGVVLDELVSNSIRHGLRGQAGHPIDIALEVSGGEVLMQIEDEGVAFDPTQAPAEVLAGTLAERKAGGMGIAFVRKLMDSVEYRRAGERNSLTLRRRLR